MSIFSKLASAASSKIQEDAFRIASKTCEDIAQKFADKDKPEQEKGALMCAKILGKLADLSGQDAVKDVSFAGQVATRFIQGAFGEKKL